MFPLFLVATVLNSALSYVIAFHLYRSWLTNPSVAGKYYAIFYFLFGSAWALWALVYIPVSADVKAVIDTVGFTFFLFSASGLLYVPLALINQFSVARFVSFGALIIALIYGADRIMTNKPMEIVQTGVFYMWMSFQNQRQIYTLGTVSSITTVVITVVFYFMSHSAKERIQVKSFYLSAAKFIFLLAAVIAFIISPGTLIAYTMAGILVSCSLLITLITVSLPILSEGSSVTTTPEKV